MRIIHDLLSQQRMIPVGYEPLKGTEPNEYFYNLFNSGFSNMPTEVNMKLARSVLLKRRIRRTYPNGVYVARTRKLMTDRFWFWVRMVVGSMQYRKQENITRYFIYIYYIIAFYFVQHRNLDFQPNFHILQNASNY